ncbi:MAG: R3H domain-containing nucleic acid-binding protein [candidate division WOR-3 bacterium]|nr:R3H domain-containing nucleic acid-binding protein [candidate division WOR-3 bacterium]
MVNQGIEIKAANMEEAIKKGLDELSLKSRDQMDWEVLTEGEEGVRLKVRKKEEKKEQLVLDEINTLLEKFGTTGKIFVEKEGKRLYVNITTKDMDGLLIGKSGKNLESFQHLMSRIIHSKDNSIDFVIDVAGYRKKKERTLTIRAKAFAQEVKRTKRAYIFQPLPPSLRRVIHLVISDIEGVRTYTIGEEDMKKVVIAPTRK